MGKGLVISTPILYFEFISFIINEKSACNMRPSLLMRGVWSWLNGG